MKTRTALESIKPQSRHTSPQPGARAARRALTAAVMLSALAGSLQTASAGPISLSAARDNLATASGGTVNNSGGYVTITFTGSGSITLPGTVNGVSELIVGGGGSGASGWGGGNNDGGGGGGGVLNLTGQTLGTSTTVTIGNQGGQSNPGNAGQQGGSSSIGGNTASGGLGGQNYGGNSGSPQNNGGGYGAPSGNYYGGGGGGAGGGGGSGSGGSGAGSGGAGGPGLVGIITGGTYGGGGGGCGTANSSGCNYGPGGSGGGGAGAGWGQGSNGVGGGSNTGGGGGGAFHNQYGGAGGTGFAAVQYAYNPAAFAATVNNSTSYSLAGTSTLDGFGTGGTLTMSGVLSGSGAVTIASSHDAGGNVVYNNANTYSGGTTLSAGTLQIGTGGTSGSVAGDITDNGALSFNRSDAVTFSGAISGSGSLAMLGTGTLILSGANTYSGSTTISAGTLQIGAGGTSGAPGAGAVLNNAALNFNRSDSISVGNTISGSGSLTQSGAGTLTLSGGNSYTGGTAINGGTLALGSSGAVGSSGTISFGGGTLQWSSANTTDYSGRFSSAAGQACNLDTGGQNVTLAAALSSSGGTLTKGGAGALTLSGNSSYTGTTTISAGTVNLNGTINSSTNVVVNGGILQFGSTFANRLKDSGTLNVAGGTVAIGANIELVGSVTLSSGSITSTTGRLLSGSYAVQSGTVSARLSGAANLAKTTGGTVTLSGANDYSGNTIVSGGTLALSGSGSIDYCSGLSLAAGATFDVSALPSPYTLNVALNASGTGTAVGTTAAALQGASGGVVDFGTQPIVLAYDGTHPALYLAQGTLQLEGNAWTVNVSGAPLASGTYTLVQQAGGAINNLGSHTVSGTAIGPGVTASIVVQGAQVNLVIGTPTTTTLALIAGANPSTYGDALTFRATVSPAPPNGESITFMDGATVLGTGLTSGGVATLSTNNLPAAAHTLTASYAGDGTYLASSGTLAQTVNPRPVAVSGARPYDGTTNASFAILSVGNQLGSDDVSMVSGTGGLASANVGTPSITSTNDLALGGRAGDQLHHLGGQRLGDHQPDEHYGHGGGQHQDLRRYYQRGSHADNHLGQPPGRRYGRVH